MNNTRLLSVAVAITLYAQIVSAQGLITYNPPQIGAPATRVGGGTRGLNTNMPQLEVLAPPQTALTNQSQPVLYWYLSPNDMSIVEISVIQEGVAPPLLETTLPPLQQAGVQRIRLADYGVSLQPGQDYRWSVAIVKDKEQRSGDIVASATLRYQMPAAPLDSIEQQAEAGYWYDALQQAIEKHSPLANELLKQIGLEIPAF